ncbi:MAG TPA: hypothetical protein VN048_20165, partial [Verrucomicrobiae bacterium]|nr:hypothetical protein [Verrucomicrobiae bacterium]
ADFFQGGETLVSNRISYYESLYPNQADDPYWTNYLFTSPVSGVPVGGAVSTWVGKVATNPFALSPGLLPGSYVYSSIYRIAANAQSNNSPTGLTTAVWQDVALEYLPVFNFAIFYNGTLEFSDTAPLIVNGPVHGNTNIDVGTTSFSHLTFNGFVTAGGIITNPSAIGISQTNWVATNTTFNGLPVPGYATGQPSITLPIGTNSLDPNSVREIINPPIPGESVTNPIAAQRYYNKADLIIVITNAVVGTNLITNSISALTTNAVTVYVNNSMFDSSPLIFAVTNGLTGGTNNGIDDGAAWANWSEVGFTNWLSFTNEFFDQRQQSSNHVVQIDVGKLGVWIGTSIDGCTNAYLTSKWNRTTPFNGIVYIQDLRITNTNWMNCVRLVDGKNITNGLYQTGLTLATQNPLYIMGNYNCPTLTNVLSTNTIGCRPCSVICDALTILSPDWTNQGINNYDAISMNSFTTRPAADDTVNTAIIAGNVPTTDTTATGFSGGVHNLPRMLEDWTGNNLWLNTSIICLYPSVQASQQFQLPGNYYDPPTRHISFDLNFLNPATLPPGTPMQTFVERLDRLTPSPSANPSQ